MQQVFALAEFAFLLVVAIGCFALLIAKTRIIETMEDGQECTQNSEKIATTR